MAEAVAVEVAADGADPRETTMTSRHDMDTTMTQHARIRPSRLLVAAACAFALGASVPAAWAQGQAPRAAAAANLPAQATYASPEAAAKALYDAVKADDLRAIYTALGPGSGKVIFSGDRVADDAMRNDLVASWDKAMTIDRAGSDTKAVLLIGPNGTPFPFPLVKDARGWHFDAKAGAEEVINRRIGENEISAIKVCLAYVDAQREYVERDRDGNGTMEYAQKLLSTPGKKDGLFWPTAAGEEPSPLGPMVADARAQGYGKGGAAAKPRASGARAPFHGYYYRILTSQGKNARGGAYNYIVNGKMIGGFAMVAYPARFGSSGVMTFVCNHDGVVFEKDLGPRTPEIAAAMKAFDPDASWRKTEP